MPVAFQWAYRESREGFWGDQTSTLNWCEEDYNISPWCAEFINTTTNFIFMYLGYKGIRNCQLYGHGPVFIVAFVGYIIVGLGSMAFHSTLKYSMQLADELPMIYTTCVMAFATFSYSQPKRFTSLVGVFLAGLALFITVYYHLSQNPAFHQAAYTTLTVATVFRGMSVMETQLRPALKERSSSQPHTDMLMRQMWALSTTGIAFFLVGFGLWSLDNIYCSQLRSIRDYLLLPWSILFEGHGWWHLFTGLGSFFLITWRIWLTRCLDGSEREFMLDWPSVFTSVPKVVPRSGSAVANGINGNMNGSSQKMH